VPRRYRWFPGLTLMLAGFALSLAFRSSAARGASTTPAAGLPQKPKVAAAKVASSPLSAPDELVMDLGLSLEKARGLDAITLMREIWAHWEDADPAVIEATLRASLVQPAYGPSEAVYARALLGYARLRPVSPRYLRPMKSRRSPSSWGALMMAKSARCVTERCQPFFPMVGSISDR
jgi:hypothetical protein